MVLIPSKKVDALSTVVVSRTVETVVFVTTIVWTRTEVMVLVIAVVDNTDMGRSEGEGEEVVCVERAFGDTAGCAALLLWWRWWWLL